MALSLRLATGEVRTYRTSYPGWGDNPSYHTECGKSWPNCPEQGEECDHLDCAIKAAKKEATQWLMFLVYWLLISILGGSRILESVYKGGWAILLIAFSILNLVLAIYVLYHEKKEMNELNEYKNICTIRGIKALKI